MAQRKLKSHFMTSASFKAPRVRSRRAKLGLPSINAASATCKTADLPWLRPEALEALRDLPETLGRIEGDSEEEVA